MPHLFNSIVLLVMACATLFQPKPPPTGQALMAILFFGLSLASAFAWALKPKPRPLTAYDLLKLKDELYRRAAK